MKIALDSAPTTDMDLEQQLLLDNTKKNIESIGLYIVHHPQKMDELVQHCLTDQKKLAQRAAWVLGKLGETNPNLITPYWGKLLAQCNKPQLSDAYKRNLTRCLHFGHLQKEYHETALNYCFEYLCNPKEAIATRVWSMGFIANLSTEYPELEEELLRIIADAIEHQEKSPAYKAKARHVQRQLSKRKKAKQR